MHMASSSIPLTAAGTSPPLAVLRPYDLNTSCVCYSDAQTAVITTEEGVFNPRAKISVEISTEKIEPGRTFVNLRFCYSNKYIGRSDDGVIPVAEVKQPDTSTLFELLAFAGADNICYFCHVQSQQFLIVNEAIGTLEINVCTDETRPGIYFLIVDWQTLVKLPQSVAFKGNNGSYLKGSSIDGLRLLQFSGDDPNNEESMHEVEAQNDGSVRFKCFYFSKNYWRYGSSWIRADTQDATDNTFIFWPVKLDDTTIALRNAYNNKFCVSISEGHAVNCIDADSPTITTQAHFVVQELVSGRNISDVVYRLADARIFNEQPYTAGSTSADNDTDEDASISVSLTYTYTTSYSFSNSTSLTAGVKVTIEADLLDIVKGSVETSFEVSESLEWGQTITTEKSITATGLVTVPPKTSAIVYYVGTIGTCNVPFSYMRQDTSSVDGNITYTSEDDGIYTGVNAYNFTFQFENPES